MQEVLDDVVGEYDGSSYYYSIDSIGTEADTALKCHYVNVRILFQVLNVTDMKPFIGIKKIWYGDVIDEA